MAETRATMSARAASGAPVISAPSLMGFTSSMLALAARRGYLTHPGLAHTERRKCLPLLSLAYTLPCAPLETRALVLAATCAHQPRKLDSSSVRAMMACKA